MMNTHSVCGNSELIRYVSIDEYGNKDYECLMQKVTIILFQDYNQRRWVEYNDYFLV